MRTVWKYVWPLPSDIAAFDMPRGSEVLCVREQGDRTLCLWALVDTDQPKVKRKFTLCGTGHPAPEGEYVGTALLDEDSLVLHVFEDVTEDWRDKVM